MISLNELFTILIPILTMFEKLWNIFFLLQKGLNNLWENNNHVEHMKKCSAWFVGFKYQKKICTFEKRRCEISNGCNSYKFLSCQVVLWQLLVAIWVLSHFEYYSYLSFVTIWVLKKFHHLIWFFSQLFFRFVITSFSFVTF